MLNCISIISVLFLYMLKTMDGFRQILILCESCNCRRSSVIIINAASISFISFGLLFQWKSGNVGNNNNNKIIKDKNKSNNFNSCRYRCCFVTPPAPASRWTLSPARLIRCVKTSKLSVYCLFTVWRAKNFFHNSVVYFCCDCTRIQLRVLEHSNARENERAFNGVYVSLECRLVCSVQLRYLVGEGYSRWLTVCWHTRRMRATPLQQWGGERLRVWVGGCLLVDTFKQKSLVVVVVEVEVWTGCDYEGLRMRQGWVVVSTLLSFVVVIVFGALMLLL